MASLTADMQRAGIWMDKLMLRHPTWETSPAGILGPDFWDESMGMVEVKVDMYPKDTGNFFWERYSSLTTKREGGAHRSLLEGIDVLCYYITVTGTVYYFNDMQALVIRIDDYVKRKKPRLHYIKNQGYTTAGYALPRLHFSDLYTKEGLK